MCLIRNFFQSLKHRLPKESRAGNVSSLSKLQQLTNGLDIVQPCNTPPAASINLTPSPNHHPHNTMTPPPPASHLVNQNRIATPPSTTPFPSLPYHKYQYSSNISHIQNPSANLPPNLTPSNLTSNISSTQRSRSTARNTPSAPNLISPPYALNGYRMSAQQPSSYIANSAAGFINNPSQLQITNMTMNMPSQYQDPAALQRAAAVQQNSMYPTYPYLMNNPMRR